MLAGCTFRAGRRVAALTVIAVVAVASPAPADPIADSIVAADAVARIGDRFIARSTFDRWFGVAASSNPATDARRVRPAGVRRLREGRARDGAEARTGPAGATDAQLKAQCRQEYEGLRDQVLQFLILESWVAQETLERGNGPSEAELEAAFQKAKDDTFPKESDFREFLEQSGMTVEDARFQVAFNTRYTKLREDAIAKVKPVTDKDVAAYYKKHKRQFFQTQRRDVRVVLTRTLARAYAAIAALRRGRFWKSVAKKYSIDRRRSTAAGSSGASRGEARSGPSATPLFRAPKDALRGPVKARFGYYVFRVMEIHPARQLTLKQASRTIRQEIEAQRQKAADDKFNEDFRTKWRARTTCRAGFLMDQCSNGPLPARRRARRLVGLAPGRRRRLAVYAGWSSGFSVGHVLRLEGRGALGVVLDVDRIVVSISRSGRPIRENARHTMPISA